MKAEDVDAIARALQEALREFGRSLADVQDQSSVYVVQRAAEAAGRAEGAFRRVLRESGCIEKKEIRPGMFAVRDLD